MGTEWDFFVSHASEDKEMVARPLAEEIRRAGFRVWLDSFELRVGDSLRAKIDEGLARSHYGIVILSPAFFRKSWTSAELGALVAIETSGGSRILPVWHQVTRDEVVRYSPILADRVALLSTLGPSRLAETLIEQLPHLAEPDLFVRRFHDLDGHLLPASHHRQLADRFDHYDLFFQSQSDDRKRTLRRLNTLSYLRTFGMEMRILKDRLAKLGFYGGAVDDTYDEEVAEGLARFQDSRMMRQVDGFFGELTYREMIHALIERGLVRWKS